MTAKNWIEPTEVVPVPTPEEIQNWYPSERLFHVEVNVKTGERKEIDLTLDEQRVGHAAKIVSRNEYVTRKQEETRKARRQAILDKLIDAELAKEI